MKFTRCRVAMATACLVFVSLGAVVGGTAIRVSAPVKTGVSLSNLAPAAPGGWVPVVLGDGQVFVPPSFLMRYNSPVCLPVATPGAPSQSGEVFVNAPRGAFHCPSGKASILMTTVALRTATGSIPSGRPRYINAIAVYAYAAGPATSYLAPSLGLEITITGPMGQQVLHTLTRSPRVAVLSPATVLVVPASWHAVKFAGLAFSVPATWPIIRTDQMPPLGAVCATRGVAFPKAAVTLSTDQHPMAAPGCPSVVTTPQMPIDGLQVDSGPGSQAASLASFSGKCLKIGSLTACPGTAPPYSILVVKVFFPSGNKSIIVAIGLAGNGTVARTILHSLQSA